MIKKDIKNSELVISSDGTLYHINLKKADNIPKNIFLVGDPDRAYAVAKYFDPVKSCKAGISPPASTRVKRGEKAKLFNRVDKGITFESKNREFITLTGIYKGIPMAVIGTGIGPDNVEIVSVELHVLNEYNHKTDKWEKDYEPLNIIRIGTSGSPQKNIPVGSLAVSQYSIGVDNTGHYYPYNSTDQTLKNIQQAINKTDIAKTRAYVSKASNNVVKALIKGCKNIGLEQNKGRGFYTGITCAASGFYGPQGRKIGRLSNILIPDLQKILENIDVNGLRVVNNEMESSVIFRLLGEILKYNTGCICAVIGNRNKGEVVQPEEYTNSIDRCIRAGLEAMKILNE